MFGLLASGQEHEEHVRLVAHLAPLREAHVRDCSIVLDPLTSAVLAWLGDGQLERVLQMPRKEQGSWVVLRGHVQKHWFVGSAKIQVILLHGNRLMLKSTGNWITEKVRKIAKRQAK